MSEEEKKVVELLQHCQNTYIEDTLVTSLQLTTEEAKILLNLVESQQKENIYNAKTQEIKEIPISDDYISKDKIRHIRDKAEVMDYYCLNDVIDDLTKLIGE